MKLADRFKTIKLLNVLWVWKGGIWQWNKNKVNHDADESQKKIFVILTIIETVTACMWFCNVNTWKKNQNQNPNENPQYSLLTKKTLNECKRCRYRLNWYFQCWFIDKFVTAVVRLYRTLSRAPDCMIG